MIDIASQIERLASLMDRGLITREEFEQHKQQLMREGASSDSTVTDPSVLKERFSSPTLERMLTSGDTLAPAAMGASIGPYHVLEKIGQGGMGEVYRARHRTEAFANRAGGDVAIKVLHSQYASRPDIVDRFEQEAALGIELDHPCIVRVHELIMDGGRVALVMELVEGRLLSEMIGSETGPIPWERASPLLTQLLDAVQYAHSKGVVHRDLKPDNMIVSQDGSLKILDFGIAKVETASRTRTGTGMGTVDYMAPEQYTNASTVDRRADVYALGMTLYEMLAGRLPWGDEATEFEVLKLKERGEFPPPTTFYPYIPEPLVAIIQVATNPDPGQRFSKISLIQALVGRLPGDLVASVNAVTEAISSEQALESTDPAIPAPGNPLRIPNLTLSPGLQKSLDDGRLALTAAWVVVATGLLPGIIPRSGSRYFEVGWFKSTDSMSELFFYAMSHLLLCFIGLYLAKGVIACPGYRGPRPLWMALASLGAFLVIRDSYMLRGRLIDITPQSMLIGVQIGYLGLLGAAFRMKDLPQQYRVALGVLSGLLLVGGLQLFAERDAIVGLVYIFTGLLTAGLCFGQVRFSRSLALLLAVPVLVYISQLGEPELSRIRSEIPMLPLFLRGLELMVSVFVPFAIGTAVTKESLGTP